jgi:myb proto-oncogene protein
VNPNIKKEKWTAEEDAQLLDLVGRFGNAWAEISRRLDGRTDQQCMGRWRRHLDPAIKREAWQAREDAALTSLVRKHGSQWSAISKNIDGRTAQQCRARHAPLHSSLCTRS